MSAKLNTVLLVDDNPIDRLVHARVLNQSGVVKTVIECGSGADALACLLDQRLRQEAVIFLDIHMPTMSGLDFLDAAAAEYGHHIAQTVVVMLTTPLSPHDRARLSRHACVSEQIEKPLTSEQVLNLAARIGVC